MINSTLIEYYRHHSTKYLCEYLENQKSPRNKILNYVIFLAILGVILAIMGFYSPIFARSEIENIKVIDTGQRVYLQKNFEENIKNKYPGSYVYFPTDGIAHIKQTKYIKSKPIKINIIEINTKVNPYLKLKPQIAGEQLNKKTTVRRIANKEQAIVAINAGFFKPQTGVPLGALMIDGEVLTGPIFNRVGLAIFEENNEISFKMENISFDIRAYTKSEMVKIDNINQPRMLSTYTLIYTDVWSKFSPVAPKAGLNMQIEGNKIKQISPQPLEIPHNGYVISGPKNIIEKLAKNREIYVEIKPQENLKNAKHIIGAGPYLVKNSEIYVDYQAQKLHAISGKNPRSAIGYSNDGKIIIMTIDGREQSSVGVTLNELAYLMKKVGCDYAMNFDGGSSSALFVDGKIVNSAVNKEGIAVSNALTVIENNPDELVISGI